jgi:hypothetical protein
MWIGALLTLAIGVGAWFAFLAPEPAKKPLARPAPAPAPAPAPLPPPPEPTAKVETGRDWPLYGNGPARTRYMAGVDLRPPFRQLWAFNGGKLIEFQPVLANGRLFVLKNDGRALALSAQTGRIRWRKRIGALAASAPATGGASVYFVVNAGGYGGIAGAGPAKVVAVNRRSGRIRWSKRLGAASESSPLVVGERVYLGSQSGAVYALSAHSGRILWRYQAGGPVKSALSFAKGRLYFGDYGGSVTARADRCPRTARAAAAVSGRTEPARTSTPLPPSPPCRACAPRCSSAPTAAASWRWTRATAARSGAITAGGRSPAPPA